MQPLALPNYSCLGSVIDPERDYYAAVEAVRKAGWRYLGGGATASAYLSPRGDRVVKIVRGDDGNRATLDACLAKPDNPHLPTVYGFLDLADDHFAVELERLEPQSGEHSKWERTWSPGRGTNVSSTLPSFITEAADCPMKEALTALHAAAVEYPEMCWDCHGGNIMIRPGTGEIVLNDLLYGESQGFYSSDRAECERCRDTFDPEMGGCVVDDAHWCDDCVNEHAVHCEHAQEWVEADEDDATVLQVIVQTWMAGQPWLVREGRIAAANREAFEEAEGAIWDGERYVEKNLHAVLTAITGIAQQIEADLEQPRFDFRLAA